MRRHLRKKFKRRGGGTCLAVQWLRVHTTTAVGTGSIPGWGTKIPHAVSNDPPPKKRWNYLKMSIALKIR